jgi:predicted RNA binding protein YcfA (HicA-like mRNA interferase family)
MGRIAPISRRELVQRLRALGFRGPYSGGRHELMVRGTRRVILPNPHRGDISADLLARILRQAGVTREEWESREGDHG